MKISMKPQTITPKFEGTVRQLFFKKIRAQCEYRHRTYLMAEQYH